MTVLTGKLIDVAGAGFDEPDAFLVFSSIITRPGVEAGSVVLQELHRLSLDGSGGSFTTPDLVPGPVRVKLEGGTVYGVFWDVTVPESSSAVQLVDLIDSQVDWAPDVVLEAQQAAREAAASAAAAAASAKVFTDANAVLVARGEAEAAAAAAAASAKVFTDANAVLVARGEAEAAAAAAASSATNAKASETNAASLLSTKADLVGGLVPTAQLPAVALTKPQVVSDRAGMLALTAQEGDVAVITAGADKGTYMLGPGASTNFASWVALAAPTDAVTSVNGQTGVVNLAASDVGAAPSSHTHTSAQVSDATSSATASMVMKRDSAGRAQVADPSAPLDVANKGWVDANKVNSVATPRIVYGTDSNAIDYEYPLDAASSPSSIMQRDSAGRAQVADPSAGADIATKSYVDSHVGSTPLTMNVSQMSNYRVLFPTISHPVIANDTVNYQLTVNGGAQPILHIHNGTNNYFNVCTLDTGKSGEVEQTQIQPGKSGVIAVGKSDASPFKMYFTNGGIPCVGFIRIRVIA